MHVERPPAKDAELRAQRDLIMRLRVAQLDEREARALERKRFERHARELEYEADELETERELADDRAFQYRELLLRLGKPIEAGDLDVVVRDNRMVIRPPYDVVFDSGKTEIKGRGERALVAVAEALKTMPDREFQVAGHTDSVPISTDRFPSNWELSMARSIRVLRFLSSKGVPVSSLSAAAYADVDPIAPNHHPDGRRQNRRIEITLQPRIESDIADPP